MLIKPLSNYIFFLFLSFYKQILASCILLLCQISIMTPYPVGYEGQQKQDVLYRDNANNGVIMEENALHRNSGSSDKRNVTLSFFLNLFPAHVRVARQSSSTCLDVRKSPSIVLCDGGSSLTEVSCRKSSFGCSSKQGKCGEKSTVCTIDGKRKTFVTGCECL